MIGIALAESDRPPEKSRLKSPIKEVAELMDPVPALPPKLIELGHGISRYYVAPIGEAFLPAMLPPEIELRHDREYALTDAGRGHLEKLARAPELADMESAERVLQPFRAGRRAFTSGEIHRQAGGDAAAEQLVRKGYLTARDVVRQRKARTQKIVAWKNPCRGDRVVRKSNSDRGKNPRSADRDARSASNACAR